MLNVQQITSDLARLPDQSLQRYAAMHKDDPYVLSLALSEANRRKQLRAGGQQQAQPQPSVADQAVAGMAPQPQQLPENVGIGALPAPNMQRMAEGGITGYADGDLIYSNEPVLRMADGGMVAFAEGDLVKDTPLQKLLKDRARYVASGADTSAIDQAISYMRGNMGRGSVNPAPALSSEALGPVPGTDDGSVLGGSFSLGNKSVNTDLGPVPGSDSTDIFGGAKAVPVVRPSSEAPTVTKPAKAPGVGSAVSPAVPAKDVFGLASLREAQREAMGDSDYEVGAVRNQLVGMNAANVQRAEDRLAARKQEIEQEGDVFKERTGQIAAREKELEKSKDITSGLAFLQAAGAMLQPGMHWTTALGKGITTGATQYGEGLEKLRAAQERLNDAKDRNEELRLNRSDMNKREIRQLERERDDSFSKGQELLFGFAKDVYGANRQDTRDLMKVYTEGQMRRALTQMELEGRKDIARMELQGRKEIAAMLPGEVRGLMLLGTGKTDAERYDSGLRRMQDITADKTGMKAAELLTKINADERKNNEPLTSMQDLLTMMRQYSALTNPKVGNADQLLARPPR